MRAGYELAGRYSLEQLLGQGAVGEVWRARDRELDRLVAVKVIRDRVADPKLAAGLLREARIAGRLRHPGITVVHDAGEHEGQPFIVMELLHGRDLGAVLADWPGGLPVEQAVSLAIQVADALAAAHAGGVVHRDLKPANLFLQDDGQLKICDFGIAVAAGAASSLVSVSYVVGTPAYMAPEQCDGREAGEPGDVYSLGCVLHALLTGRPPFMSGPPLAVMAQHRTAVPAGPRALRRAVPVGLDQFVTALLAKDPGARPGGAGEVAAALRALQGEPGGAGAVPDPARALDGAARAPDPASWDAVPRGAAVPAGQAPAAAAARASGPAAGPEAVSSRQFLAISDDSTVELWDLATRWRVAVLGGFPSPIYQMCAVTVRGRQLLAFAASDRTVRLLDPATGRQAGRPEGHKRKISAVCPVTAGGRQLLAIGDDDGAVLLWDPETRQQAGALEGHKRRINEACQVTVSGRRFLATASKDRTVRLWDPATGQQAAVLRGYRGWVITMCPVTAGGRPLLAAGSTDGTVRLWDLATGQQAAVMDRHPGQPKILPEVIHTIFPVTAGRQSLLAAINAGGAMLLWDLATGRQATVTHWDQSRLFPPGSVSAICPVTAGRRSLLAIGHRSGAVRLWDLATGQRAATLHGRSPVRAICPVAVSQAD